MKLPNVKKLLLTTQTVCSVFALAGNITALQAAEKSTDKPSANTKPAVTEQKSDLMAYLPAKADFYIYVTEELLPVFFSQNSLKSLNKIAPEIDKYKGKGAQAAVFPKITNTDTIPSILFYGVNYYDDPALTKQQFSQEAPANVKNLPKDIKLQKVKFENKDALTLSAPIDDLGTIYKMRIVQENAHVISTIMALGGELPAKGFSSRSPLKDPSKDTILEISFNIAEIFKKLPDEVSADPDFAMAEKMGETKLTLTRNNKKYLLNAQIACKDEETAKLQYTNLIQPAVKAIGEDPTFQSIFPDFSASATGKSIQIKSTVDAEQIQLLTDGLFMMFSDSVEAILNDAASNDITVEKESNTSTVK